MDKNKSCPRLGSCYKIFTPEVFLAIYIKISFELPHLNFTFIHLHGKVITKREFEFGFA